MGSFDSAQIAGLVGVYVYIRSTRQILSFKKYQII